MRLRLFFTLFLTLSSTFLTQARKQPPRLTPRRSSVSRSQISLPPPPVLQMPPMLPSEPPPPLDPIPTPPASPPPPSQPPTPELSQIPHWIKTELHYEDDEEKDNEDDDLGNFVVEDAKNISLDSSLDSSFAAYSGAFEARDRMRQRQQDGEEKEHSIGGNDDSDLDDNNSEPGDHDSNSDESDDGIQNSLQNMHLSDDPDSSPEPDTSDSNDESDDDKSKEVRDQVLTILLETPDGNPPQPIIISAAAQQQAMSVAQPPPPPPPPQRPKMPTSKRPPLPPPPPPSPSQDLNISIEAQQQAVNNALINAANKGSLESVTEILIEYKAHITAQGVQAALSKTLSKIRDTPENNEDYVAIIEVLLKNPSTCNHVTVELVDQALRIALVQKNSNLIFILINNTTNIYSYIKEPIIETFEQALKQFASEAKQIVVFSQPIQIMRSIVQYMNEPLPQDLAREALRIALEKKNHDLIFPLISYPASSCRYEQKTVADILSTMLEIKQPAKNIEEVFNAALSKIEAGKTYKEYALSIRVIEAILPHAFNVFQTILPQETAVRALDIATTKGSPQLTAALIRNHATSQWYDEAILIEAIKQAFKTKAGRDIATAILIYHKQRLEKDGFREIVVHAAQMQNGLFIEEFLSHKNLHTIKNNEQKTDQKIISSVDVDDEAAQKENKPQRINLLGSYEQFLTSIICALTSIFEKEAYTKIITTLFHNPGFLNIVTPLIKSGDESINNTLKTGLGLLYEHTKRLEVEGAIIEKVFLSEPYVCYFQKKDEKKTIEQAVLNQQASLIDEKKSNEHAPVRPKPIQLTSRKKELKTQEPPIDIKSVSLASSDLVLVSMLQGLCAIVDDEKYLDSVRKLLHREQFKNSVDSLSLLEEHKDLVAAFGNTFLRIINLKPSKKKEPIKDKAIEFFLASKLPYLRYLSAEVLQKALENKNLPHDIQALITLELDQRKLDLSQCCSAL